MMAITREEFSRISGLTATALNNRSRRAAWEIVLAFGCDLPARHGRYVPLDAVAMALVDELPVKDRRTAVRLVRAFHEDWLAAVVRAEWERGGKVYFGVAETWDDARARYYVAAGTLREIADAVDAATDAPVTLTHVNIAHVLVRVRKAARDAGIDLSAPFALPRDHADYTALAAEIERHKAASRERLRAKGRRPQRRPINMHRAGDASCVSMSASVAVRLNGVTA